jgi:hypothetical protein
VLSGRRAFATALPCCTGEFSLDDGVKKHHYGYGAGPFRSTGA